MIDRNTARFPSRRGPGVRLSGLFLVPVLGAVLAFVAAPAFTADPDAATILERAESIRSPDEDYAVDFELLVRNPASSWKERTARYTLIAHGKDHSLVLMREPEQFHPGTLLISKGLYWLLLPRSSKPFQLAPRHVLNGDISNGDLARGNLVAYYEPRLLGEGNIDRHDCWQIELRRANNRAMYPKIRAWIRKKDFRPWRLEYFGETGTLVKVADYRDYRETPLGVRAMRIEVENKQRRGESTTMTFSEIRRLDSSSLVFSRDALVAFRDAAKTRLETDGAQARPEDLIEMLAGPRP